MNSPKINPYAIDLLARDFKSHKRGLPEWMKNAREAYLRVPGAPDDRLVIINHLRDRKSSATYLECIDFVGISHADIEERFLEWANPQAVGLTPEQREGGQGNGGKAYLRQLFDKGYFISICHGDLSVVTFVDKEKYRLDFVSEDTLPGIRRYCQDWLEALGRAREANITVVRGVGPKKPVEADQLMREIQQFPQARETIKTCTVHYFENGEFRRELHVMDPHRHPEFPAPVKISIPESLEWNGKKVITARPPDYQPGELELSISAKPLVGQALSSWNRIDFRSVGVRSIGYKAIDELLLDFPQFARHVYGACRLPLLTDPDDNYEAQGRGPLVPGPLSEALYRFIAGEADRLLQSSRSKPWAP